MRNCVNSTDLAAWCARAAETARAAENLRQNLDELAATMPRGGDPAARAYALLDFFRGMGMPQPHGDAANARAEVLKARMASTVDACMYSARDLLFNALGEWHRLCDEGALPDDVVVRRADFAEGGIGRIGSGATALAVGTLRHLRPDHPLHGLVAKPYRSHGGPAVILGNAGARRWLVEDVLARTAAWQKPQEEEEAERQRVEELQRQLAERHQ
jgi:hypothetical protein